MFICFIIVVIVLILIYYVVIRKSSTPTKTLTMTDTSTNSTETISTGQIVDFTYSTQSIIAYTDGSQIVLVDPTTKKKTPMRPQSTPVQTMASYGSSIYYVSNKIMYIYNLPTNQTTSVSNVKMVWDADTMFIMTTDDNIVALGKSSNVVPPSINQDPSVERVKHYGDITLTLSS